jgi:polyhydroxybutyrate depolymerase
MPKIDDETVDDVGFIRLLIDGLIAEKIADAGRIYVTGSSRGGLLTYTIACLFSNRIAAAAPLITGMTEYQKEDCHPSRPVPMLLIAGTSDNVEVYDGWIFPVGRLMSVVETIEYWRVLAGCTGQQAGLLPHLNSSDRTRVGVINWTGCRKETGIRFYKVIGGGHQVPSLAGIGNPMSEQRFGPRNRDIESAAEIWSFLKQFSLSAP